MESVHRMAMNAYEDQCTPANPRMPMVKDMEDIMTRIYDYETPYADLYPEFAKERDARTAKKK